VNIRQPLRVDHIYLWNWDAIWYSFISRDDGRIIPSNRSATMSAWSPWTGESVLASAALSLHRLHLAPPQSRHLTVSVFSHSRPLTGELIVLAAACFVNAPDKKGTLAKNLRSGI
jgi:hypothetical protein